MQRCEEKLPLNLSQQPRPIKGAAFSAAVFYLAAEKEIYMTKKPINFVYLVLIGTSFFLANYAAQHVWPLWTITLAGAVSLASVVAYIFTMQSQ